MACECLDGCMTLFLSPALRGAQDSIRGPVEQLLRSKATLQIASQQLSDRGIVNSLADIRSARGERAYVLVEADYLHERKPVPFESVWNAQGEREAHRQCLSALLRACIEVRTDEVSSALQHINLINSKSGDGSYNTLLTSANFAPGSLTQHFNWGLSIADDQIGAALDKAYSQAWDGDFRDVNLDHTKTADGEAVARLCAGSAGQASELAVKAIEAAQKSIDFAYFNMGKDGRVTGAMAAAAIRGVKVSGIVDGDQEMASWDAVPALRAAGVDVRYYPGALTGAIGRMHYKMFAVDESCVHLSTANASLAAESSLELAVTLYGSDVSDPLSYVRNEISRLFSGSTI